MPENKDGWSMVVADITTLRGELSVTRNELEGMKALHGFAEEEVSALRGELEETRRERDRAKEMARIHRNSAVTERVAHANTLRDHKKTADALGRWMAEAVNERAARKEAERRAEAWREWAEDACSPHGALGVPQGTDDEVMYFLHETMGRIHATNANARTAAEAEVVRLREALEDHRRVVSRCDNELRRAEELRSSLGAISSRAGFALTPPQKRARDGGRARLRRCRSKSGPSRSRGRPRSPHPDDGPQQHRRRTMSDYPSDDECTKWGDALYRGMGERVCLATARYFTRKGIDWTRARANPAPQEPPTHDAVPEGYALRMWGCTECDGSGIYPGRNAPLEEQGACGDCPDPEGNVWESEAIDPDGCPMGQGGMSREQAIAAAWEHRARILASAPPAEPTEAPKPTSGDPKDIKDAFAEVVYADGELAAVGAAPRVFRALARAQAHLARALGEVPSGYAADSIAPKPTSGDTERNRMLAALECMRQAQEHDNDGGQSWCWLCGMSFACEHSPWCVAAEVDAWLDYQPPRNLPHKARPTSGDKPPLPPQEWLWCGQKKPTDPRNPIPTHEPTPEPDPWALPDGWSWDGDEYGWAMWGPNGGGITSIGPGGQAVLDLGEHRAVALSELCRRRDREDPPNGGETT